MKKFHLTSWKVRKGHKVVSQLYHILYKECASKYNIWFLFYMAIFTLPQIGERNGAKTRTIKTVDTYCFSRVFMSERISTRER